MIKRVIVIIGLIFIVSCVRKMTLSNGVTKVPLKKKAYKFRELFDRSLLDVVDTSVIYEEYNRLKQKPERLVDGSYEYGNYNVYRFYSNGTVSSFYLYKKKELKPKYFDPNYKGNRGVFYEKNNEIYMRLFIPTYALMFEHWYVPTIQFKGDTLYVNGVASYIKRKIPKEYLNFKADW